MKKKILFFCLILSLCLGLGVSVFAAPDDFVIQNGVLKGYNGPDGDIVIPGTVTEIASLVSYQNETITSVTIPSSVTIIRQGAFQGLYALEEITIPDSVTYIEWYAFQDCPKLKSVRLPQHLDFLGSSCFADCTALTNVTLPKTIDYIERNVFENTPWIKTQGEFPILNGILYAYNGQSSSVVVPDGVQKIACAFEDSFAETSNITSIMIPESVTEICNSAFMSCVSLKNITLPKGLKKLGSSAFWGCTSLESVVIPNGITTLEEQMFWGCTALKDVTLPASLTSIDSLAFVVDTAYDGAQQLSLGIPLTGITIHGATGSAAERYAKAANYAFVADQPADFLPAAAGIAYPAAQTVKILYSYYDENTSEDVTEERNVTFYCYALKDPSTGYFTNYAKLRDVAHAINGSSRNFNVTWDGAITLSSDAYQPNGSEMIQNFTGEQPYTISDSVVKYAGQPVILDSITLTDAAGGDYTYVKLRDIGRVMGFDVSWKDDGIVIDTWNIYNDAM